MNCSNKTIIIALTFALAIALAIGGGQALAVDTLGLFELDGDAVDNNGGDDWSTLYGGGGGANEYVYIHDITIALTPDKIFTGGNKDIHDVSDWGWKDTGGKPDKNDITNAYAAAYMDNGDLIIYFGADRYANNGDAYFSFWFFKNPVNWEPGGSFSGNHTVGDVLVLVNYPQCSGCLPIVKAAIWDPSVSKSDPDYLGQNIRELANGYGECTGPGGGSKNACAITNDASTSSPWTYMPKSGAVNNFPHESFFEGGINVTQLIGYTPCISSFMAETRSAESWTATLKDWALGDFPLCKIEVSKTCVTQRLTTEAQDPDYYDKYWFYVTYENTVTNTGIGTIPAGTAGKMEICVDDDPQGDSSNPDEDCIERNVDFAKDDYEEFSGHFYTNANPPKNNVYASVKFNWDEGTQEYSDNVLAELEDVDCDPLPLNPNLELHKECNDTVLDPIGSILAIKIQVGGYVKNTSDPEIPLTVTVTDTKIDGGPIWGPALLTSDMGDDGKVPLSGFYYPSAADIGGTDPCAAIFTDRFTATATSEVPGVDPFEVSSPPLGDFPQPPLECDICISNCD